MNHTVITAGVVAATVLSLVGVSAASAADVNIELTNRDTGPHSRNINSVDIDSRVNFSDWRDRNNHDWDWDRWDRDKKDDHDHDWDKKHKHHDRDKKHHDRDFRFYHRFFDRDHDRNHDWDRDRDHRDRFGRNVRQDVDIRNDIEINANTGRNVQEDNTRAGDIETGDIDINLDVRNEV